MKDIWRIGAKKELQEDCILYAENFTESFDIHKITEASYQINGRWEPRSEKVIGIVGWWRTGKQGMLQFTGSQRIGHDWATKAHSVSGAMLFLIFFLLW